MKNHKTSEKIHAYVFGTNEERLKICLKDHKKKFPTQDEVNCIKMEILFLENSLQTFKQINNPSSDDIQLHVAKQDFLSFLRNKMRELETNTDRNDNSDNEGKINWNGTLISLACLFEDFYMSYKDQKPMLEFKSSEHIKRFLIKNFLFNYKEISKNSLDDYIGQRGKTRNEKAKKSKINIDPYISDGYPLEGKKEA